MNKVIACPNLDQLAEDMIEKILACWKNPFKSPRVILSDSKMEQWFKLKWIKSQKTNVLMNLKFERLDSFLFNLLQVSGDDFCLLNRQLLRDLIMQKLFSKVDGQFYYKCLGNGEVDSYISDASYPSEVNPIRLYDFSSKMAGLFLEYESSRNKDFLEGKGWQEKLYNDIFSEKIILDGKTYLTLPQLYNQKEADADFKLESPIFVFGFSGMGNFYRQALKRCGQENELYVYIQAFGSEMSTVNEISKELSWSGNENLELWKENSQFQFITPAYSDDSLLQKIQKEIGENKSFAGKEFSDDDSFTLTAAPNEIREVEVLHSRICRLLKEDDAGLGQILVLAPDMQKYSVAVSQIFDQLEEGSKDFPVLPYTIADSSSKDSLVAEALKILSSILEKNYLCRSDLISLIRNTVVQKSRDYSESEVSVWIDWIANLNVYRDRVSGQEIIQDWEKAKRRLLLSRLTDKKVLFGDKEYLPFSTLESENDMVLFKFVQLIDELEEWKKYSKSELSKNEIEKIQLILDNFLLMQGSIPERLAGEDYIYRRVSEELNLYKELLKDDEVVPGKCFFFALLEAGENTKLSKGSLFTHGVTFANLMPNRILSADYIFILGMDSKSFPGQTLEDILDLRRLEVLPGDSSLPEKNKDAFLCQIMSAGKGLYISYVNKDLKKDQEFYLSSTVNTFVRSVKLQPDVDKEKIISIDEKRSWKELFTPREFRNKENFDYLNDSSRKQEQNKRLKTEDQAVQSLPDRLSLSKITKYLEDPFKFNVENVFDGEEDNSDEEIIEFEPLSFDNRNSRIFQKEYVASLVKDDWDQDNFKNSLVLKNQLPDGFFGEYTISELEKKGMAAIVNLVSSLKGTQLKPEDALEFLKEKKINFDFNSELALKSGEKEWTLNGKTRWWMLEGNNLYVMDIKSGTSFLSTYVTSLAVLAQQEEKDYSVILIMATEENKENLSFSLSPSRAKSILEEIYNSIFVEKFTECVPEQLIKESEKNIANYKDGKNKELPSLEWLKEKLENSSDFGSGPWKYFTRKNLFNIYEDLNYTEKNFLERWNQNVAHQKKLILYL